MFLNRHAPGFIDQCFFTGLGINVNPIEEDYIDSNGFQIHMDTAAAPVQEEIIP